MNLVYAATEDSEIVSLSLINQKPSPARAGEIVELRFNVENSGGKSANDLQIELIPEYPFIELPGEEYVKTIKTLSAYQDDEDAVAIKYKVRVDKDAVRGTNEIKIKEGRAGSDSYTSKTFDIDVSGKEFAQIIYVDKAKLDPGKETPLKFTITDIGNSPLQNLIFSWNEENGIILPVYSDNTKYIKYIGVGESVDLEYIVVADVNAVAGLYQLDLTLKFESEDGNSNEINTRAGVFVGGETDFDVTFSESSAGQTSLSVANIGNNPALSVTVRVPEQRNFRVTGSTSSIIGNLDKGDYTIVSFQIMQAGSMPGGMAGGSRLSEEERQGAGEHAPSGSASDNNNLEVLIEYTDTTGVRRSIEKDVPIQFRSITGFASQNPHADQSGMPGRQASIWNNSKLIGPIITLVIVVSGVVFYRKIRSRKKNK
ncbi:hypothetical protein CMO89_02315 [Candidatus Woesearchaeota archaeon]|nr:hypothetical protein [Candidatus Woesearchaeota archaeon]|tara:strand:- start:1399 stop:2679 length:1281 start_codon:yes stop_codon:yes gene_type:complete